MTPTQARQWTLKEVIDFCEERMKKAQEGNPEPEKYPALHLDRFFEAEEIKKYCEQLMNSISVAA